MAKSRKHKRSQLLVLISIAISFFACSTTPKEYVTEEGVEVYSTYDPHEGSHSELEENTGTYGPVPVQIHPVVLVIGPGYARSFAAAGVLRGLADAKIPVGAIVGTEVGALIGSLYANSDTINQFEWSLKKIKNSSFTASGLKGIFGREISGSQLERSLRSIFRKREVNQTRIPFFVSAYTPQNAETLLIEDGLISEAVRGAVGYPGIFEISNWKGISVQSSAAVRPYPIAAARALGLGPVIVIDVLDIEPRDRVMGNKNELNYYQAVLNARRSADDLLRDADLIVRPRVDDIGYFDFSKRSTTIFRGKQEINKQIQRLKELVGLNRRAE